MNFPHRRFTSIFKWLQLSLTVLILVSTSLAAGEVDSTFNAAVQETTLGYVQTVLPLPDGKLFVGGNFTVAGNSGRSNVARLNADGTVDPTFVPPDFYRFNTSDLTTVVINAVAVQADGKILVGGDFARVGDTTRRGLVRLNADGSLDASFNPTFSATTPIIYEIKIQNNRIYVAGNYNLVNANGASLRTALARLNDDGSVDQAFSQPSVSGAVLSFAVQPDGKVLYSNLNSNSVSVVRRANADGSADASFPEALFQTSTSSVLVNEIVVQTSGKILVGGVFSVVNGFPQNNLTRLNADGSLDTTFNTNGLSVAGGGVYGIDVLPDEKIVIGGTFTAYNNVARQRNARLNADGTLDTTFVYNPGAQAFINVVKSLNDGRVIVGGSDSSGAWNKLTRLNQNGTVDANFVGAVYQKGRVNKVLVQPDGKILIAGLFKRVNGVARANVARLNQDGTVDTGFIADTNVSFGSASIALQPDGKVLIYVLNTFSNSLRRVNADGSTDTSFSLSQQFSPRIDNVKPLANGKILIAGVFDVNNVTVNLIRVNADGSRDTTFIPPTIAGGAVRDIEVQTDGRVFIAGEFSSVNGTNRGKIARLTATGVLDNTFNPPFGANNNINDLTVQSNGNVVIGGEFLAVNGSAVGTRPYLARFLPDGTLDTTFNAAANNLVYAVERQADDKILIGGVFSQINGAARYGIARLNANGTFDSTFTGPGTNDIVRSIAVAADGKILIGGDFSRVQGSANSVSVARLLNTPSVARTPFDFDGDGRADVSLFRPSNGSWYILPSGTGGFYGFPFGQSGDLIAPADYDGDGKTDVAVFRSTVAGAGDQAYFYILNSADNSFRAVAFGTQGDVPISGDWDGDGKGDLAVYRAARAVGGQGYFYYRPSSQPTVNFNTIVWGTFFDKPVRGDFDGDGKQDAALFRDSTATWYIIQSSNNQTIETSFGISTDIPVPADYDGDGRTNIAVFRPSNGTWYTSPNPATNYGAIVFGANGDLPVPADYDGDGRADAAVFRPSNGAWYLNRTASGLSGVQFGTSGDRPTPNAYVR